MNLINTISPQHAPSNYITETGNKAMTDDFNVTDTPYYNANRNQEEIFKLMGRDYVKIPDTAVAELREACNNTLTRGDAIAILLHKKVRNYPGLIDVNDKIDDKSKNGILTALYSEQDSATYYFMGTELEQV